MINVWTEFQPLQKVILGTAFPPDTFDWHGNREQREVMRRIFEETEEDLQDFCERCEVCRNSMNLVQLT